MLLLVPNTELEYGSAEKHHMQEVKHILPPPETKRYSERKHRMKREAGLQTPKSPCWFP
jgi:hypothetical protein